MADDEDRQYDPTPKRREDFRKDGKFARSRDAAAVVATAAVVAVLIAGERASGTAMRLLFARAHGGLEAAAVGDYRVATDAAIGALAAITGPCAFAAALAGTIVGLVQAGLHFDVGQLEIKPERLNPIGKLKQLFDPKHAAKESLLSILRVGAVGYVAWRALVIELPALLALNRLPTGPGFDTLIAAIVRVVLTSLAALAIVAAADYAQSRFSIEKQMKMTRKELMDESKAEEGDARAKARMRAKGRQNIRKRSLEGVKTADVVVTNPTHIAIALRYGPKDAAPTVVAKGHDDFALLIRAKARGLGIPIVENKPLARALDAEVALGKPILGHHFAAVARVLAYVYKIGRGTRARAARTARRASP
jgi:flagellar biosynthetic protein FlhB